MAQKMTYFLPIVPLRGRVIFPHTNVSFDVGRILSLSAVKRATAQNMLILVVAQQDSQKEDITPDDLYEVGTVCKIKQLTKLPSSNLRLSVEGICRVRVNHIEMMEGAYLADANEITPVHGEEMLEEAYFRTAKYILREMTGSENRFPKDAITTLEGCTEPDTLCDLAGYYLNIKVEAKQAILEEERVVERLRFVEKMLNDEVEISRLERKISAAVRSNIDQNQKEYYLREQIKAIHAELGDDEEEKEELKRKIEERKMPKEVEEKALKELNRMSKMQTSSPDYNVLRVYLDWLIDLPWDEKTTDTELLADAVKVLNEDHYGLEKIKERITEYLAVLKLTDGMNAPILCLVGPPGVGKTSIATSVARALGRKFVRMSLGGVRDEAEIRGHRKTYVGAIPGRIIAGIKNAGTTNPVFLLDEIDKLASDHQGDPASALLEVLDPNQNATFRDRYLEVPYDLSKVLFITTANSVDTIPGPLLDRMELIELSGYTHEEKKEIAKRYLIPKKIKANGLKEEFVNITDDGLDDIISGHTREAGVRNLERRIDAVCRKIAVQFADKSQEKVFVTAENLVDFLGAKRYDKDATVVDNDEVGAATGLAWTAVGGTTLTIEVATLQGKGDILLTGKLGDVMKESARAAVTYIRANATRYGLEYDVFEKTDIHIHVPEGATPKDGPSAGITMATAILSAFTKKPVKKSVAMTGEITLRGKVLPIGGLKEKSLAAYRIGVTEVLFPKDNAKDLEDIPQVVREKINFVPVSTVATVFEHAIVGL